MSKPIRVLAIVALGSALVSPVMGFQGIGRPATPAEIAAWDIDVRPDFQGLPRGSGTVRRGQEIWESKCESCHGPFGESNEVFTPLVGGTTRDDQKTGHVAALTGNTAPHRTTLMKVATVSTLYDYIRRAMPWNAPKSLSNDDVYAVTAYLLNLGDVVPDDFVLDQDSIREVQQRMPNRNGMTRDHGLWDVKGKPDTANVACMTNCVREAHVESSLPDYARNAHGNLADQSRTFGAIRGTVTDTTAKDTGTQAAQPGAAPSVQAMASGNGCLACHGVSNKIVGPALHDIATRYQAKPGAAAELTVKVRAGGQGTWGNVPMPPQSQLSEAQARQLVDWILGGAN